MSLDLFIGVMLGITASAFYIAQENPCETLNNENNFNHSRNVHVSPGHGRRYPLHGNETRYQL